MFFAYDLAIYTAVRRREAENALKQARILYAAGRDAEAMRLVQRSLSFHATREAERFKGQLRGHTNSSGAKAIRAVLRLGVNEPHSTLGIPRGADVAAVQRAYLALARQLHPDRNQSPGAEEAFKRLTNAKDVLTDEARRAEVGAELGASAEATPPRWQDPAPRVSGEWAADGEDSAGSASEDGELGASPPPPQEPPSPLSGPPHGTVRGGGRLPGATGRGASRSASDNPKTRAVIRKGGRGRGQAAPTQPD